MVKKMKKSAQANVITLVSIILISLVAIIIVWNIVNSFIKDSSSKIDIEQFKTNLRIEEVNLWESGGGQVRISRMGSGKIDKLKLMFRLKDGSTETKLIEQDLPEEGDIKTYDFEYNNVEEVSIAPILGSDIGIEVVESKPAKDSGGERVLETQDYLVSWWKFEGDASDSVGENHGQIFGDADELVNDVEKGDVIEFDGNDYVTVPDHDSLGMRAHDLSISLWYKYNVYSDGQTVLANKNVDGVDMGYGFYSSGGMNIKLGNGGGQSFCSITDTIDNINWHHLVVVIDRDAGYIS